MEQRPQDAWPELAGRHRRAGLERRDLAHADLRGVLGPVIRDAPSRAREFGQKLTRLAGFAAALSFFLAVRVAASPGGGWLALIAWRAERARA